MMKPISFNKQLSGMEHVGQKAGYFFAYFVFTSMLYFLNTFFLKLLPSTWSYVHFLILTGVIACAASLRKVFL